MVHQSLRRGALLLLLGGIAACADLTPPTAPVSDPPPTPREFRAAWVATVANIDWPSRKDLSVAAQQAEIIAILDRAKALRLNAIILQVRTSADALYHSAIEPWSEYLTGTQGLAPEPFYDPLAIWVEEAHRRGLELHAWFNPYRARHSRAASKPSASHVANTMPHAVKSYGGYLWMDPGEVEASAQTLKVILDVVKRYDIDGVHIDDYFYPYPVPLPGSETPPPSADDTPAPRAELPFPDEPAWQRYRRAGGTLVRDDWRRDNVNTLIEKIYSGIKAEKRWVKFGISPFGIGRPDRRPPTIKGFSQYDKLYADAEHWFAQGWLDYFTPQLYWPINQEAQAFAVLLDNWIKENTRGRHLWPGLYTTRILNSEAAAKSWEASEIIEQISLLRQRGESSAMTRGHVHFSMIGLMQNRRGIGDQLLSKSYPVDALIPASPWLGNKRLRAPKLSVVKGNLPLTLNLHDSDALATQQYVVWSSRSGRWRFDIRQAGLASGGKSSITSIAIDPNDLADRMVVIPVDRFGNEGESASITAREISRAL